MPIEKIWIDDEAMGGIPETSEEKIYNCPDNNPKPPNNKREMPCKDCSMQTACAAKWNPAEQIDCLALRNWYNSGNYEDSEIEFKLKRVA